MSNLRNAFWTLVISLAIFSGVSYACTNFIVTKGASKDGSTMVSYSADSFTFYGELYHYPAAVYPDASMVDVYEWDTGKYLGRIKQVHETYNVIGNMNEYQVVIGETTFGGREELVNPKGIVDYGSLIYLALQRSKSAREAIKVMTDLVNEYGYYSEGESFSVADPNEAWILEMLGHGPNSKGAIWAALLLQWIRSELAGRSILPTAFWYLSLAGSGILLFYAIHKRDPVFTLGQGAGLLIYARNLHLIRRPAAPGPTLPDGSNPV